MPRKSKGLERGAPEKIIDWEEADKLLIGGSTGTQVAAHFGVHPATLYDRCYKEKGVIFSEYSQQKREKGDSLLHAKQFASAMKGNVTMQIWLGKIRLGQKDPSMKELKSIQEGLNDVRELIKEIERNKRISAPSRSLLEDEQSLLDQRSEREEDQVSNELGSEDSLGEPTYI